MGRPFTSQTARSFEASLPSVRLIHPGNIDPFMGLPQRSKALRRVARSTTVLEVNLPHQQFRGEAQIIANVSAIDPPGICATDEKNENDLQ